MRKKVFICSPFRGDMEGNARKAAAYCRMACEQGFLPVAPHLLFPQFLNEGIEEERRLGIGEQGWLAEWRGKLLYKNENC